MGDYDWLEKRTLRSVDQLRLWSDNPRLDPEEKHVSVVDYVSDLVADNGEKDSFLRLVNSISSGGYIPADPIVVWKNSDNDKYYVAEGNRRVLALKLFRNPDKAPRSIRSYIRSKAETVNRDSIEKIKVCVAPSFEECEWYVNQRHSPISIQRSWSRLQQQRWVASIYDKYNGNIDKVIAITQLTKSQLEYTLRILKIRDLSLEPEVYNKLTKEDQESVKSHRIPITIFERWFMNPVVKERWGFDFNGESLVIASSRRSFLAAYAKWIKLVIHRDEPDSIVQINTRTITSDLEKILQALPIVSFEVEDVSSLENSNESDGDDNKADCSSEEEQGVDSTGQEKSDKIVPPLRRNPDRNQLVIPSGKLKTTNFKIKALFREFKVIPVARYKNCIAVSLRVFVDLAVSEYIIAENLKDDISNHYHRKFSDVALKQRLEYLKKNNLKSKTPSYKVVEKLLNPKNEYSLDTLNNYVHGDQTHYTSKRFLNGFWDFLYPLFEILMDIKDS